MSRALIVAALAGVCLVSAGCKWLPGKPDPAALCAAPSTAAGVGGVAYANNPFAGDIKLILDTPVLESVDTTTKKTTCVATLKLQFSGALAGVDPNTALSTVAVGLTGGEPTDAGLLRQRSEYSIQPEADGSGQVYELSRPVANALAEWAAAAEMLAKQSSKATTPSDTQTTTEAGDNSAQAPAQTEDAGGDNNSANNSTADPNQ